MQHAATAKGMGSTLSDRDFADQLLDRIDRGDTEGALASMAACPEAFAEQVHDTLLLAFWSDGVMGDPTDLPDCALLALALLLGASGRRRAVGVFLDEVSHDRDAEWFRAPAALIAAHYAEGRA
ncbi:hypothetical protein [Sphingomonas sp.]|uniref:hypothetical protein n=1 Tax=Sphingomonas sp. TaxID=28214 RepID=UPI001AFF68E8|nr:hypothetical protein [Sphingomonas sp.]MBO9712518.1 hypothetical protein [Sphingomonas sp.]